MVIILSRGTCTCVMRQGKLLAMNNPWIGHGETLEQAGSGTIVSHPLGEYSFIKSLSILLLHLQKA